MERCAWRVYKQCLGTTLNSSYNHAFSSHYHLVRSLWWWILNISRRLIDHAYSPFHAVLHCGNLSSDVQVFPRPEPVIIDEEVDPLPQSVNTGNQLAGVWTAVCFSLLSTQESLILLVSFRFGNCGLYWNNRHLQSACHIQTLGAAHCCQQRLALSSLSLGLNIPSEQNIWSLPFNFRDGWSWCWSHRRTWGGTFSQPDGRQESQLLCASTRQSEGGGNGGSGATGVSRDLPRPFLQHGFHVHNFVLRRLLFPQARVVRHALLASRQQEEIQPDDVHLWAWFRSPPLAGQDLPPGTNIRYSCTAWCSLSICPFSGWVFKMMCVSLLRSWT